MHRWEIIDGFAAQMRAGTALQLAGRPWILLNTGRSYSGMSGESAGGGGTASNVYWLVSLDY